MNTRKLTAALAVMGAFVLASSAATTTTNVAWNIDFEGIRNPSYEKGNIAYLTNKVSWTWADGSAYARFTTVGSDASKMSDLTEYNLTNGWETTYPAGCAPSADLLELNTSGEDLTFNLVESESNDTIKPVGDKDSSVLVDADVYFVGADSEPSVSADTSLQAALFLKCDTAQEDDQEHGITAGDITNTTLRVWSYDGTLTRNVWRSLSHPTVTIEDGSWHHVQIVMDYTGTYPEVKVLIDGYAMEDENGDTSFRISNFSNFESDSAKHLNSVSFRGTGAIDNFVGTSLTTTSMSYEFSVDAYTDQETPAFDPSTPTTVPEGSVATFLADTYAVGGAGLVPLKMIRVENLVSGTTSDYVFEVDMQGMPILTPPAGSESLFDIDNVSWKITLTLDTTGATGDSVLAHLYYGSYPGEATSFALDYDLGGGDWPDGYSKTNSWMASYGQLSLPDPTKEGYAFDGWSVGGSPASFPMTIEADTTFTATWKALYLVTFKDGETTLSSTNVLENTTVDQPADPVKTGFVFDKWVVIDGASTNEFAFSTAITAATTIYATWTAEEKPEVQQVNITSFVMNGTTATIGFTTKQVGVKYYLLSSATLAGTYVAVETDGASKVATAADAAETLTATATADAMFFKLGADWPEE